MSFPEPNLRTHALTFARRDVCATIGKSYTEEIRDECYLGRSYRFLAVTIRKLADENSEPPTRAQVALHRRLVVPSSSFDNAFDRVIREGRSVHARFLRFRSMFVRRLVATANTAIASSFNFPSFDNAFDRVIREGRSIYVRSFFTISIDVPSSS